MGIMFDMTGNNSFSGIGNIVAMNDDGTIVVVGHDVNAMMMITRRF